MLDNVNYDRLWPRLIDYLNEWATAREVPGGIVVTFEDEEGRSRTVEVVTSPKDWDEFVSTIYGDGDPSKTHIKAVVTSAPVGVPFLVYNNAYDWTASSTRDVPEPDFDLGPGEWLATDREGKVVSRFADFNDTP
jgi:hypothetical protein